VAYSKQSVATAIISELSSETANCLIYSNQVLCKISATFLGLICRQNKWDSFVAEAMKYKQVAQTCIVHCSRDLYLWEEACALPTESLLCIVIYWLINFFSFLNSFCPPVLSVCHLKKNSTLLNFLLCIPKLNFLCLYSMYALPFSFMCNFLWWPM